MAGARRCFFGYPSLCWVALKENRKEHRRKTEAIWGGSPKTTHLRGWLVCFEESVTQDGFDFPLGFTLRNPTMSTLQGRPIALSLNPKARNQSTKSDLHYGREIKEPKRKPPDCLNNVQSHLARGEP